MWKGYWLHTSNHRQKPRKSGLCYAVGLIFIFYILPFLYAAPLITVQQITALAQKQQGDAQKRYLAWAKLLATLKNKPVKTQLKQVNDFFNQFLYEEDIDSRGVDDYWKSPAEFIVDGGGDCEDFAIIKYFTLVALGIPTDALRITYVTSLVLHQPHMVLSYYATPEAEPLILDSLEPNIVPASQRRDLKPVYSFNGDGLWLAKQRGQNALGPNTLGKWDELMKRMN